MNWEWYDDHNTTRLFIHCLLMANHKDKKWRGNLIKRGTFLTSYEKLSESVGLTRQQVRTSINKLKSTHEITCESTSLNTVITICEYDSYQSIDGNVTHELTGHPTIDQPTSNQRTTTTNNINNIDTTRLVLDTNTCDQSFDARKPKKIGMNIERFFKDNFPDEFNSDQIGCPELWGEWAVEFANEYAPDVEIENMVLEINTSFDTFYDYFKSLTGKNSTKKCWFTTWKNWWRREFKTMANYKRRQNEIYRNKKF